MYRFLTVCFVIALLTIIGCGEGEETQSQQDGGISTADTVDMAMLKRGTVYQISNELLLYPEEGKENISDSVMNELIVMPPDSRFKVVDIENAEGKVWYRVDVTGGPVTGWRTVDSAIFPDGFILTAIGSQGPLRGWLLSKDLEYKVLAEVKRDTTTEEAGK